ncbi:hypothetical protein [Streptosporangium subroseum]|nr:hypothetical protein OHB15_19920 [Streptosporangium subroseum]
MQSRQPDPAIQVVAEIGGRPAGLKGRHESGSEPDRRLPLD